jgi:hypothetical protein
MSKTKYEKINTADYNSMKEKADEFKSILVSVPENPISDFMKYHIDSIINKVNSELEKTKKAEVIAKIKSGEISVKSITQE